jgi:glycosyltransferase involved in cell wall biosynthesis
MVFAAARWWDEGKNPSVLDAAAERTKWPVFAAGPTSGPNGEATVFRHVNSLGPLPNREVRSLMGRAGIFVSPSLYEPFGLAALEAASCGTPLLLADIPTYRELWDGAAAFFAPRDATALAETLDRLVSDRSGRKALGAAALRRSRRFTVSRQAQAMRAVYDDVLPVHAENT